MTKPVRYQKGQLYQDHGAWFVRYRDRVRQENGSIKLQRRTRRLGDVEEFPTKSDVEMLRTALMQKINAGQFSPDSSMTLTQFVGSAYLPWVETERRASTNKGYREIWENHIRERVGQIRMREFRTVHASKMLRTIADECDLTKTTLQHIKSVLSGVFTYAKNEGAYDGFNPVQGAMIPGKAREPEETYAYNMVQILRILQILPLLPKAVVATASLAGLREGELRGLEWPDYTGEALAVNRSVWKGIVNRPKTRTSRQPVPVIPKLANLLDERQKHGYGQVSPARDSSGSRSDRATVVWLARFPPRDRLQPLSVGRKRKDRAADSASRQATRHQRPLHQGF